MKKSKKIIALLCTVSILATSLVFAFRTKAEKPLETLDPTLERVTFKDFSIDDGTYTAKNGGDAFAKLGSSVSLEGKVFTGNITFNNSTAYLYFGGEDYNSWRGLSIAGNVDGVPDGCLVMAFGDDTYTLTPQIAGCDLIGKPFNLKLTYHTLDKNNNGSKDTLQLGVWFNDKLYNNEYFEVSTYRNGERDYTNYLVGMIGIRPEGSNGAIEIGSDLRGAEEILDENLKQISFDSYGIADRTYTSTVEGVDTPVVGDFVIRKYYGYDLTNKVFSADVTFSERPAYLYFGDKEDAWNGFYFASGQDGTASDSLLFCFGDKTYEFKSDIAGCSLVENEFNLKLSYQVVDNDRNGQVDSLKLGVWFNGKLYNNGYFYLSTYKNGAKDYTYYLSGWSSIVMGTKTSYLTIKSDVVQTLDPNLTKITFKDYKIADDTYTYNGGDVAKRGYQWESLDGKVFSGYVTFTEQDAYLYFGGKEDPWGGFYIASGTDHDDLDSLMFAFGDDTYTFTPEIAKTTLVGAEFNLKLSYQVIDTNDDTIKDTLQLGVWFNDVLYNNKYFYLTTYANGTKDYTEYLTGACGIQPATSSATLTVVSDVPRVLDPSLEKITFSDYGVPDAIYTYNAQQDFAKRGSYWESLDGKVFSGDVTFTEAPALLHFGDKEDHWSGFYLASGQYSDDPDALKFHFIDDDYKMTPEIAGSPLVGTPVNLKLSYQVIDKNKDGNADTLQLGVWFNDVLYNNKYFYLSTYANGTKDYTYYLSGFLLVQPATSTASITIASEVPEVPEILNPQLAQITFKDFGIENDTYGYSGDLTKKGFYNGTLAGRVFSGDVKFSEKASYLFVGGEPDLWYGISISSGQEGYPKDALVLTIGKQNYTLYRDIAGEDLVDKMINLKLSYELEDKDSDGEDDQLKFGVWINGKLYDNEYYYISTYEHPQSKYGIRDYNDFLNAGMAIFPGTKSSSLTVASDYVEKLDASMTEITFTDFGIKDGTYKYADDFSAKGYYQGSLSGKVFTGDITFTEAPAYLYIGGEPNAWYGISIASGQEGVNNDCLLVKIGDQSYTLSPAVIGTVLVGKEINLKISYNELDKDADGVNDALQVGVWINGKLYQNEYFEVSSYVHDETSYGERTYKDFLTGHMGLYAATKDAKLVIASDVPETLDPSLEKVTFTDFSVNNATYNTVGGFKVGYYNGTLAGKVFSGNVTFSQKRSDLWIGAQEDAWYGLGILSGYSKDKTVLTVLYNGREYTLDPKVAGATLVGKSFNLKLSYQLVDENGDGKEDTLKLGIWINDRLYNDEYMYIQDYENCIGPYMAIHTPYQGSAMTVESDVIVLNPAKGSRSLATPPTGDAMQSTVYVIVGTLALAVVLFVYAKRRRETERRP